MADRRPQQFGVTKLHETTSLVLKADGTVHSEARHYPYGEERWSSGTVPSEGGSDTHPLPSTAIPSSGFDRKFSSGYNVHLRPGAGRKFCCVPK
jgi:hypothetical protein